MVQRTLSSLRNTTALVVRAPSLRTCALHWLSKAGMVASASSATASADESGRRRIIVLAWKTVDHKGLRATESPDRRGTARARVAPPPPPSRGAVGRR